MTAQTLIISLFGQKASIDDELLYAIEAIADMSSPGLLAPVLQRLGHMHAVDKIFQGHLSGKPHGLEANWPETTPTFGPLAENIRQTDEWYVDYVSGISADALEEVLSFTFLDGKTGRMSREEMLAHVITHDHYHRGEIGVLLPHVGAVGRRDSLAGHLHRAEPERRR